MSITIATSIGTLTGAAGLWYKVASWIDPNDETEKAIDRKSVATALPTT